MFFIFCDFLLFILFSFLFGAAAFHLLCFVLIRSLFIKFLLCRLFTFILFLCQQLRFCFAVVSSSSFFTFRLFSFSVPYTVRMLGNFCSLLLLFVCLFVSLFVYYLMRIENRRIFFFPNQKKKKYVELDGFVCFVSGSMHNDFGIELIQSAFDFKTKF